MPIYDDFVRGNKIKLLILQMCVCPVVTLTVRSALHLTRHTEDIPKVAAECGVTLFHFWGAGCKFKRGDQFMYAGRMPP